MHIQIFAAFIVYFCIVLMIGLFGSRMAESEKEFIMGGRKLNFWFTALSAHASDMSAWLFMAFPGAVFLGGAPACWIALGLIVGMFLNWQYVARKLRIQTEQLDSYTLPTFFERRFRDNSGIVRYLTAVLTIVFFCHYLAALLKAMGQLLGPLFGIDEGLGMSIATAVVITYTLIGGYLTIAMMDFFQAIFLLAILLIIPMLATGYLQPGDIALRAQDVGISLSFAPEWSLAWMGNVLAVAVSWCLGYFGMPHILTKFMGIAHVEEMNKAKYLGMSWLLLTLTGAAAIGFIGIAFFPNGLEKPEFVFIEMVKMLFSPFFAGFVLCGILGATLSTMDSQILCCATVISEDIYRRLCSKPVSSKKMLHASRSAVVAVAAIALFLAFSKTATILDAVHYSWAGMGCCFGPLVILALYSKRVNAIGAIVGLIFGGSFALIWPTVRPLITDYDLSAIIGGFPLTMLLTYVVSLLTAKKSEAVEQTGHHHHERLS